MYLQPEEVQYFLDYMNFKYNNLNASHKLCLKTRLLNNHSNNNRIFHYQCFHKYGCFSQRNELGAASQDRDSMHRRA
jgi:hypothetical protein